MFQIRCKNIIFVKKCCIVRISRLGCVIVWRVRISSEPNWIKVLLGWHYAGLQEIIPLGINTVHFLCVFMYTWPTLFVYSVVMRAVMLHIEENIFKGQNKTKTWYHKVKLYFLSNFIFFSILYSQKYTTNCTWFTVSYIGCFIIKKHNIKSSKI